MQTRAYLVGLVEKFCVQTQYTYTYTTELWATPSGLGQGRKEQRSTSEIQFIQSFTTALQCCVSWFCPVDVFLKGEVNSAGTLHTDSKLTAKESEMTKTILEPLIHSQVFTFSRSPPCYLLTLDKRQSFLSQLKLPQAWEVLCPGIPAPVFQSSCTQNQLLLRKVLLWNR